MKTIIPPHLNIGDRISLISPASSPDDLSRLQKAKDYFTTLGYDVIFGKNTGKYYGYLAGTDDERAFDVHKAFLDSKVKAIICLRGGYGSPRILDKLDYKLIRKHAKIFVGYSDITAMHSAFLRQAGIITFSGPMAAVDFHKEPNAYTEKIFWEMINGKLSFPWRIPIPPDWKITIERKGIAEGQLIGGNLALFVSLIGTPYFPKVKNRILFLEDIGESPYRVDRLLNQLKLSGVLNKISGLIIGQFTDCQELDSSKKTLTLDEIFKNYTQGLQIPIISNFPNGHIPEICTLPIGSNVLLNATKGYVELLNSPVV